MSRNNHGGRDPPQFNYDFAPTDMGFAVTHASALLSRAGYLTTSDATLVALAEHAKSLVGRIKLKII